jgi:monothiol glutaredoxin
VITVRAMTRPLLDSNKLSPEATQRIETFHPEVIAEVERAIAASPVVVVGMAQNPFVKRARKALQEAGIEFQYVEYGSYLSKWKERLAIKMWSGWPTFPQVFVKGELLGGQDLTAAAIADGSLKKRLGQNA